MNPDAELIYFKNTDEWRNWLADHGMDVTELWVGLYKKGSSKIGITYEDAVNEALCYGWIDGLTKTVDEESYKVRFTPRKPKGNWSASNIARVKVLIEKGKMTPAGMVHIAAAQQHGRWNNNQ